MITYDDANGIIIVANMDLKESEKRTHKLYLLKFYINSSIKLSCEITF